MDFFEDVGLKLQALTGHTVIFKVGCFFEIDDTSVHKEKIFPSWNSFMFNHKGLKPGDNIMNNMITEKNN